MKIVLLDHVALPLVDFEASVQYVKQEPADKLVGIQFHGPGAGLVAILGSSIVFPAEPNLPVLVAYQSVVGDGYPMSVPTEVTHNLLRVSKGRFLARSAANIFFHKGVIDTLLSHRRR